MNSMLRWAPSGLALLIGHAVAADLPTSALADGDTIILKSTMGGLKPLSPGDVPPSPRDGASAPTFVAPARTKFKVTKDDDGKYFVSVKDVPCEAVGSRREVASISRAAQLIGRITVTDDDCRLSPLVAEGRSYEVEKAEIEKFGYSRFGFVYGGLVVPYKYFRHDKSLEPGTTIGPFMGYRWGQTGWGMSVIATYAITDIKVRVKDGTELKDRTFFGLSRGVGLMFDITKSETPFRAGILWGKDRVGSNNVDVYPHDGKTWIAAQLGWEFGR